MDISVVVATYGSPEWEERGADCAASVTETCELVTVHLDDEDATLARARNEGAARARGDWLCFLDADDRLEYGYLDAMCDSMFGWFGDDGYHKLGLLVPAVRYTNRGRPIVEEASIPAWTAPLIEVNCAVIGTLISRELFVELGGFGEEPIYEDWALWCRAVRAGAVMHAVPEAVYLAEKQPHGRNAGQQALATYKAVRADLEPGFDWGNVRAYKTPFPDIAAS